CERLVGLDPAADVDAAHVGEVDVQQHDVDGVTVRELERVPASCRFYDAKARPAHDLRLDEAARLVVVDYENQRLFARRIHEAFGTAIAVFTALAITDRSASRVSEDLDNTAIARTSC